MTLSCSACERRAYRLATLLTGDPSKAVGILEAVERSQPDLLAIDSARLDRLTILRSREVTSGPLPAEALPADAAGAIADLATQPREAWMLIRAYGLPLRETALGDGLLGDGDEAPHRARRSFAPAQASSPMVWCSEVCRSD